MWELVTMPPSAIAGYLLGLSHSTSLLISCARSLPNVFNDIVPSLLSNTNTIWDEDISIPENKLDELYATLQSALNNSWLNDNDTIAESTLSSNKLKDIGSSSNN